MAESWVEYEACCEHRSGAKNDKHSLGRDMIDRHPPIPRDIPMLLRVQWVVVGMRMGNRLACSAILAVPVIKVSVYGRRNFLLFRFWEGLPKTDYTPCGPHMGLS